MSAGRPGLCLALLLIAAVPAYAQSTPKGGNGVTLPGSGGQPAAGNGQTCVQVQIPGQKPSPFNCLNQQLQSQAQGTHQSSPSLPLGANSPSNKVGTFNEQGLQEQYGQNFGKSVVPFRPPAPVFSNALHP
jgi:hypothetical protein